MKKTVIKLSLYICLLTVFLLMANGPLMAANESEYPYLPYNSQKLDSVMQKGFETPEEQRIRMKKQESTSLVGIKVEEGRFVVRLFEQSDKDKDYVDIAFDAQGINHLYGIQRITYKDGTTFQVTSDWLGPYQLSLRRQSVSDLRFTGGYHGSRGDASGDSTARTTRIQWQLDGVSLGDAKDYKEGFVYGHQLNLQVVNRIQAGDASVEILREIQEYNFEQGTLGVDVIATALTELHMHKYYGLQAQTNIWQDKTYYIYDNGAIDVNGTTWESRSLTKDNKKALRLETIGMFDDDGAHGLLMSLDDVGLGHYNYLHEGAPMGFKMSYGKVYYNLINQNELGLSTGQSTFWKGRYHFVANQTVYDWYRRQNKTKH